jgi:hypothetical protein
MYNYRQRTLNATLRCATLLVVYKFIKITPFSFISDHVEKNTGFVSTVSGRLQN